MKRLLLIDGSNLLFQMFFGMPARIVNREGKAIQGTLGFTGALLKIIRMVNPTHAAVIFDGEHENGRCEIDPDYKGNRPDFCSADESENPFSQLPDVYKALDFLSIKHAEAADCEADDIIASYALRYGAKNYEEAAENSEIGRKSKTAPETDIVVSSFDSDFFQLISENVTVLRYRGKKTVMCTPEFVMNKFGVKPGQYADFKSLTGDHADNIRGAEKIGPKTAAMLLNQFGTLENIIAGAEEIKKPFVKESVIKNTERLKNNYKIIKLSDTAKLPFALKELEYSDSGIKTNQVLEKIGLR